LHYLPHEFVRKELLALECRHALFNDGCKEVLPTRHTVSVVGVSHVAFLGLVEEGALVAVQA